MTPNGVSVDVSARIDLADAAKLLTGPQLDALFSGLGKVVATQSATDQPEPTAELVRPAPIAAPPHPG